MSRRSLEALEPLLNGDTRGQGVAGIRHHHVMAGAGEFDDLISEAVDMLTKVQVPARSA